VACGLSFNLSCRRAFDGPASFNGALELSVPCPSSLDLSSGEAAVRVKPGVGRPGLDELWKATRPGLGEMLMPPAEDGPIGRVASSLEVW